MAKPATSATAPKVRVGPPAPSVSSPAVRTIVPAKSLVRVSDIWATLPVVRVLAVRDFKARYKQSALGPLWLLIEPLGVLGAFTVIFNGVTKVDTSGIPYVLFALVGVTVWSYFQPSLALGVRCHTANKRLINSVACPRIAFVTSTLVGSLPQLSLTLVLLLIGVVALAGAPPISALLLPLCVVWLLVLAFSLVLALSALNVRFRDVSSIVPFILQGALFLSPIGYPADQAPPTIAAFLSINPLTGLIETWRWCLLGSSADLVSVGIALGWTVLFAVGGWHLFKRLEPKFADVI
jgi:lipopolysaccharide transport system permease protein